jgi:hypothetical protein
MKHLLNDLSSEEKNSILEQHNGEIKIDTSKFRTLLESKLGDSKPLITEAEQFVLVDVDGTDADILKTCVDATDADLTSAGLTASNDRKRKHKKCNAGKIKRDRSTPAKKIKYSGRPWP